MIRLTLLDYMQKLFGQGSPKEQSTINSHDMICNLCGGTEFSSFKNRGHIQCTSCGSIERTRLFALYLDRFVSLRPGMKILHLAPERLIFNHIAEIVGDGYDPCDIDPVRYKNHEFENIRVRKLDLCTDAQLLPKNHYDLILHNHVMEHIPCNYTAVLCHLHHSLAEEGMHIFSIPVTGIKYGESFADLTLEERKQRYGQSDHMRNFAREDLERTIGMIFDIKEQMTTNTPDKLFEKDLLYKHNIPPSRWRKFNGATPLILKKGDLLI